MCSAATWAVFMVAGPPGQHSTISAPFGAGAWDCKAAPMPSPRSYVDEFVAFARQHQEYKFLVTRLGCGIAGFTVAEMAPLFSEAISLPNVILPEDFVQVLASTMP